MQISQIGRGFASEISIAHIPGLKNLIITDLETFYQASQITWIPNKKVANIITIEHLFSEILWYVRLRSHEALNIRPSPS